VVDRTAYAACLRLARQHYENFPVASWLLPASSRPHIAAIYAFARAADDFADEGDRSPEERFALLDDWRTRLRSAARGTPGPGHSEQALIFRALSETIRTFGLDVALFEDLLSAFSQDITKVRYATWDDVLDYCRRSANPIGRLVLRVTGHDDKVLYGHADAVCTALQLTNFWQDIERDWHRGRVYVPQEIMSSAGADEADLARGVLSNAWRDALEDVAGRTRLLFEAGRPLSSLVRGRLRWELRATWLGGVRILDRLEAGRFDVFRHRPALGWSDAAVVGWRMLRGA